MNGKKSLDSCQNDSILHPMNRFYVYTIKDDDPFNRACLYVDENSIEDFALAEFEPISMLFSGVLIEANDHNHADEIYNLSEEGEILWVDEPKATVKKRQAFESKTRLLRSKLKGLLDTLGDAEKAASRLAISALIKGIELHLEKINRDMSYMARLVQRLSKDSPERIELEDIYTRIKKKYVEQLKEFQYKADPGHGGKTPW
jgi:hypothetical protein